MVYKQVFGQSFEQAIDVEACEGGCLDVMVEAKLLDQSNSFALRDRSILLLVCKVAHQVDEHVLVGVILDLGLPGAHRVK